jgi:hypothetical protein
MVISNEMEPRPVVLPPHSSSRWRLQCRPWQKRWKGSTNNTAKPRKTRLRILCISCKNLRIKAWIPCMTQDGDSNCSFRQWETSTSCGDSNYVRTETTNPMIQLTQFKHTRISALKLTSASVRPPNRQEHMAAYLIVQFISVSMYCSGSLCMTALQIKTRAERWTSFHFGVIHNFQMLSSWQNVFLLHIVVFWGLTPCCIQLSGYQRLGKALYLYLQGLFRIAIKLYRKAQGRVWVRLGNAYSLTVRG